MDRSELETFHIRQVFDEFISRGEKANTSNLEQFQTLVSERLEAVLINPVVRLCFNSWCS